MKPESDYHAPVDIARDPPLPIVRNPKTWEDVQKRLYDRPAISVNDCYPPIIVVCDENGKHDLELGSKVTYANYKWLKIDCKDKMCVWLLFEGYNHEIAIISSLLSRHYSLGPPLSASEWLQLFSLLRCKGEKYTSFANKVAKMAIDRDEKGHLHAESFDLVEALTRLNSEQQQMVIDHLDLAAKLANKFYAQGWSKDLDELVQIANFALLYAIGTYKPEKGSFTTHAYNTVYGYLQDERSRAIGPYYHAKKAPRKNLPPKLQRNLQNLPSEKDIGDMSRISHAFTPVGESVEDKNDSVDKVVSDLLGLGDK